MPAEQITGPDGLPRKWGIEFFEADDGEKPVLNWIKHDLSPTKRRALGTAMRRVLQIHGPGVTRSDWGASIEQGIFEFRLRMNGKEIINLEAEIHGISEVDARRRFGLNPSEDVLLRVFCTTRPGTVVMLLHGYDKGEDTNRKRQQSEIAEARRRKTIVEQRHAVARKFARRAGKRNALTGDVLKHILCVADLGKTMNDFDKLIADINAEAVAEGPAAVAELHALDNRFRLASELLSARKSANLSQKELSARSGVQQAEISKIERGEVVPTLTTMNKLLHPLGRRLAVVEDNEPVAA